MELRLKTLLEQAQFTKYKGKGYDAAEVDDFLDRATAMAAKVEVQLTESMGRPGSPPSAPSGPTNAEVEAEVSRRVEARLAELPSTPEASAGPSAPPDTAAAERSAEEAAEQAHRTLLLAQRTADAAVREAREEAAQLAADARKQSEGTIAEADAHGARLRADGQAEAARDRQEARRSLDEEIHQLENLRDSLKSDVGVLEHHVEEQRSRLGSSIGDLQRLLDDPQGFRVAPTPDLADPEVPDPPTFGAAPDSAAAANGEGDTGSASGTDTDSGTDSGTDSATVSSADTDAGDEQPRSGGDQALASDGAGGSGGGGGAGGTADRVVLPVIDQAPSASFGPGSSGQRSDPGSSSSASAFAEPQGAVRTATRGGGVAISEVDHEVPGVDHQLDSGPPTSPTPAVDLDLRAAEAEPSSADDAFLAELRKAMADEQPLGPRQIDLGDQAARFGEDRPSRRFGRRR